VPPSSTPDGFSLFMGSDPFTPLFTTDDPTGSDDLFLYSIGAGAQGLSVYNLVPVRTGFSISVSPSQAPEPGSLALLVAGVVALSTRRRFMR
jgi:hypothetical protein